MFKKVIGPGLLGGLVLILWMFVVNGLLGFKSSVDLKPVSEERHVYEVLQDSIVEPGRYVVNPALSSGSFPDEEPIFSILNSGMGHGSAGRLMLFQVAVFLLAPVIAAWMLSVTSGQLLTNYPRRVLFFAAIGLLSAVYGDLMNFGISSYPLQDAVLLAVHDIAAWTVVGLVVACWVRPESDTLLQPQPART